MDTDRTHTLRHLWAAVLAVVVSGSAALAAVDCTVVDRIEQIHQAVHHLRSDPKSAHAPNNLAVLYNHLRQIDTRDVNVGLREHTNAHDITALKGLMTLAKAAQDQITTTNLDQFTRSLRTSAWDEAMARAKIAMSHMPCGVSHSQTQGDADGRELQGEQAEAIMVRRRDQIVEDIKENAFQIILFTIISFISAKYTLRWIKAKLTLRRRRSKRFATQIETTLVIDDQSFEARIIDLSCHGAKVRYWHNEELNTDKQASIELCGDTFDGRRAWSNPHYFGIQFNAPLSIELVRELADTHSVDGLGRPKIDTKKAASA